MAASRLVNQSGGGLRPLPVVPLYDYWTLTVRDRQMTFVTFPAFRQLVHTRTRCARPETRARIDTRLGSQRRLVCLLA